MRFSFFVIFATLISVTASASDLEPAVCETQANTVEMVQCADWQYKLADRWLNQAYKQVTKEMDAQAKELFRDAQRAWIKFRDAECLSERDSGRGGTIAPILGISCLAALTEERARIISAPRGLASEPGIHMSEMPGSAVIGDFKCDGKIADARIGLEALSPPDGSFVHAKLYIDNESLEWEIGGNRQDAFCGADLTLTKVPHPNNPKCLALKVEDGLCDAFTVQWNAKSNAFEWTRN